MWGIAYWHTSSYLTGLFPLVSLNLDSRQPDTQKWQPYYWQGSFREHFGNICQWSQKPSALWARDLTLENLFWANIQGYNQRVIHHRIIAKIKWDNTCDIFSLVPSAITTWISNTKKENWKKLMSNNKDSFNRDSFMHMIGNYSGVIKNHTITERIVQLI
jgi:hypothetical protein